MSDQTRELKLFWVSWFQPSQPGISWQPPIYPPELQVLGVWCTGWAEDNHVLCAYIEAYDVEDAANVVRKTWPGFKHIRFCDQIKWYKPNDRFKLELWSEQRLTKWFLENVILKIRGSLCPGIPQ